MIFFIFFFNLCHRAQLLSKTSMTLTLFMKLYLYERFWRLTSSVGTNVWGAETEQCGTKTFSQPPTQPVSGQSINKPASDFIHPAITVTVSVYPSTCPLSFYVLCPLYSLSLPHSLSSLFPPSVPTSLCRCFGMCCDHGGEVAIWVLKKEICFQWKTQNGSHFFFLFGEMIKKL